MKLKIKQYQLFLFDLDGLLIDTDKIDYQAYIEFLKKRNYELTLSFEEYLEKSRQSPSAIKEVIYNLFPDLLDQEPNWEVLYAEKKKCYIELLKTSKIAFMPGVEAFLIHILRAGKTLGVTTYSTIEEVEIIKSKVPLLKKIHNWISRENYERQKPDPQCYKRAIDKLCFNKLWTIGFEDSARGLIALLGTSAIPVLVSPIKYPQLEAYKGRYTQIASFEEIELIDR